MGFVGLLQFSLKCFDVLAWPLISLGYPLYASIRAIEANSNYHMRKLVTYWIIFSFISLFELAFAKLIEWVPFWPHVKLIAIFWLVIPRFNGAYYVYKCLLRQCLSVNLQVVINQLSKPKEESSLKTETFLAVAERYVSENGSEALEKLIASKLKGANPNLDVEEIKKISHTEQEQVVTTIQSKRKEDKIAQKDIEAVELTDQNAAAAAKCGANMVAQAEKKTVAAVEIKSAEASLAQTEKITVAAVEIKSAEASLSQTEKKTVAAVEVKSAGATLAQTEKKTVAAVEVKSAEASLAQTEKKTVAAVEVKSAEANLAETEKKTVAAAEIEEMSVPATGVEDKLPEIPALKREVQTEWTCAVCQVKTSSEAILNSHLQGKKHRAKCEELKAGKQTAKNKGSSSSTTKKSDQANQKPKNCSFGDGANENKTTKQEGKKQFKKTKVKNMHAEMQPKYWCHICKVWCPGETDMAAHLNGRKHLSQTQIQNMDNTVGDGQGWDGAGGAFGWTQFQNMDNSVSDGQGWEPGFGQGWVPSFPYFGQGWEPAFKQGSD